MPDFGLESAPSQNEQMGGIFRFLQKHQNMGFHMQRCAHVFMRMRMLQKRQGRHSTASPADS